MVQFNLLPDIKIKYIKARRQKRLLMLVAGGIGAGSLTLVALMASYVYIVQGAQIASLDDTIDKSLSSIQNKQTQVDDINKVLTVQNQLNALDGLHSAKPVSSRIFGYLAKLKPESVTVTKVTVKLIEGENTMVIEGETQALESVNTFIDTLKFSKFSTKTIDAEAVDGEEAETIPIFTEVVLTEFSRDKNTATYIMSMKYDPLIFSSTVAPSNLVVPKDFISTRSAVESPVIQDGLINQEQEGQE